MIATIRWAAIIIATVTILALAAAGPASSATALLAALFILMFVIVCWTFGAFRKDVWMADDETSAYCDALDQILPRGRDIGGERS